MRKSIFVFLCFIFILPILSFVGCGSVTNYVISAKVNDASYGRISGYGTFAEGSSVTLTTNALSTKKFVGWVFDETNLLTNDSTFSISTETNNLRSTISFKVSKETAGKYTAIFEDENMMWTKFSSIRFSTLESSTEQEDSSELQNMLSAELTLFNGTNSAGLDQVFSQTAQAFKENVAQTIETNKLFYTSYEKQNQILLKTKLIYGDNATRSLDLRANFECKTDSNGFVDVHTENYDYSYKVTYNNGYEIVFKYPVGDSNFNFIFLKYIDLGN